ncbi:hypothetical protein C4D60_Mb07t05330 [Musa balbisiana]|uniref:Uncharacterized protein n=1 Tax=Musa balbisiana TaxID=52838 RepID=A0A4S8JD40_MUSBA|nr:hypothetical protein C4D60_Mb07t05330 [Musa balbisiana]
MVGYRPALDECDELENISAEGEGSGIDGGGGTSELAEEEADVVPHVLRNPKLRHRQDVKEGGEVDNLLVDLSGKGLGPEEDESAAAGGAMVKMGLEAVENEKNLAEAKRSQSRERKVNAAVVVISDGEE